MSKKKMLRFFTVLSIFTGFALTSFAQEEPVLPSVEAEQAFFTGKRVQEVFNGHETITIEINYVDGKMEGEVLQYYEDGTLGSRSEYKNDVPEGPYAAYHKNGNIQLEGAYSNGLAHGLFKSYNENGELLREWTMENGKQVGETTEHALELDLP